MKQYLDLIQKVLIGKVIPKNIINLIFHIGKYGTTSRITENEEASDEENDDDEQKKYNQLKREKEEKDDKIQELEKKYLESISRLLIMIQVHCEIKADMYNKLKES